jgi:hypothetical protein
MAEYSLVPVEHQPDFENVSLVPVDHDPFSDSGTLLQAPTQLAQMPIQSPQSQPQVQQAQFWQPQAEPAQPEPPAQPQQPATAADQPAVDGPVPGSGHGGASGSGEDDSNNPPSDQGGAEPAPFGGYANPTLAESLVNQAKMNAQKEMIEADPRAGRYLDGGELYRFATTKLPISEFPIDGNTGCQFTTDRPFYAFDGKRHAIIDASPERPVTVKIPQDGKFSMTRP